MNNIASMLTDYPEMDVRFTVFFPTGEMQKIHYSFKKRMMNRAVYEEVETFKTYESRMLGEHTVPNPEELQFLFFLNHLFHVELANEADSNI